MLSSTKKTIPVLSALSAALISLPACKTVEVQIKIAAKPATVWSVISSAGAYEQWNPVHVKVEGEFTENAEVKIHLKQPDGKVNAFPARVRRFVANQELNQGGGVPGIFTFNHTFTIDALEGGTLLKQREEFRGLGVLFYNADWVQDGYTRVNQAVKARAEVMEKADRLTR